MDETGLVLRPFIDPWLVSALAAAVVVLSVVGYARTTRSVSRRFKLLLLALRLGATAAAVTCLVRPTLETTHYELVKRPLILLVDHSRSMSEINDTREGQS
ncbi:MAG: hypothetical protein ACYS1C_12145, partial [Planctomycetota bacterium]